VVKEDMAIMHPCRPGSLSYYRNCNTPG